MPDLDPATRRKRQLELLREAAALGGPGWQWTPQRGGWCREHGSLTSPAVPHLEAVFVGLSHMRDVHGHDLADAIAQVRVKLDEDNPGGATVHTQSVA